MLDKYTLIHWDTGVWEGSADNWSGRVRLYPRASYAAASLDERGVYVLVGPQLDDLRGVKVYIGKAERLSSRLARHDAERHWWEQVAVVTGAGLSGDMVGQIEGRLISLARRAGVEVENANDPAPIAMSPADLASTEAFLARAVALLKALGVDAFAAPPSSQINASEWLLERNGARGRATMREGKLVVLAGSLAREFTTPGCPSLILTRRENMLRSGILVRDGATLRFTEDVPFDSPSAAAGVLLGASANGRIEWRDQTGRTWQDMTPKTGDVG